MLVANQVQPDRLGEEVVDAFTASLPGADDDRGGVDRAGQVGPRAVRSSGQVAQLPGHRCPVQGLSQLGLQFIAPLPPVVVGAVRFQRRVPHGAVRSLVVDDSGRVGVAEVEPAAHRLLPL